jgi:hypothetical protein
VLHPRATRSTAPIAPPAAAEPVPVDPFTAWLTTDAPPADGFGPPVGRGFCACGDGCWTARDPHPVAAIATGTVEEADADHVIVRHAFYEDETPRVVTSTWRGLVDPPAVGTIVDRGDPMGAATRLAVDVGEPFAAFVAAHDQLIVPQDAAILGLVSRDAGELRVYADGDETARFSVAFGQVYGAKDRRGDNRTPKGLYWIVQRSRGPFTGDYADYYGGLWLRLDYPNRWDAARGVDEGLISGAEARAITAAFDAREATPSGTKLGGGIGTPTPTRSTPPFRTAR